MNPTPRTTLVQPRPVCVPVLGVLVLCGFSAPSAQAALVDRGGGMIYDDVLNITWLQDANQGAGSDYDDGSSTTDGRMTWANAKAWAEDLDFGGYQDWRLPTILDTGAPGCNVAYSGTDCGYNVQTKGGTTVFSELAHLWYVTLGNKALFDTAGGVQQPGWGYNNRGPFINTPAAAYWSATELALASDPGRAWNFGTFNGFQGIDNQNTWFHAWAVRNGDVGADVPLPAAAWLLLSGLGGLAALGRRRQASTKRGSPR